MGPVLQSLLRKYGIRGIIRQGENGCPSEETQKFALHNYPWTEFSQAKWDLRRFIGDFCHGVPSSVFTICDFNHIGRQINRKGLLMADEEHNVLRPKQVYGSIQNMTTLFNDLLEQTFGAGAIRCKNTCQFFTFTKQGKRMAAFWDRSAVPGNETCTGKADIIMRDFQLQDPMLIDVLSGAVYEVPQESVKRLGDITLYLEIPCADSPFVLADKGFVDVE
jgi:hypothetical protein